MLKVRGRGSSNLNRSSGHQPTIRVGANVSCGSNSLHPSYRIRPNNMLLRPQRNSVISLPRFTYDIYIKDSFYVRSVSAILVVAIASVFLFEAIALAGPILLFLGAVGLLGYVINSALTKEGSNVPTNLVTPRGGNLDGNSVNDTCVGSSR